MKNAASRTTIGIPVYNEIRFIERTLRSSLGQADEILISDNASTDGTSEICKKFAENHSEIKYIRHNENKGAWFNFAYTLENSENDYFMWLGGHDLLPLNHVEKLKNILDTTDAVCAYSNAVHLTEDYVFKYFYEYGYAGELLSDNPAERVFSIIKNLVDCTVFHGLYKKSILIKSMGDAYNDTYFGSDHGILGEVAYNGKMQLCHNTIYYRTSPRQDENDTLRYWSRVLHSVYASQDNEMLYRPENIPIGICFTHLQTAEKASSCAIDKGRYIDSVKYTLSMRFGYNDLINKYIEENFNIKSVHRIKSISTKIKDIAKILLPESFYNFVKNIFHTACCLLQEKKNNMR
ncbi:MAG: glycosyltransferase [Desulfovibrio sp.]|jgi:glycosyltransferase involved in cell wall biosynthesis|nr:glycosyltransferase [Desulfovibrio sp.]